MTVIDGLMITGLILITVSLVGLLILGIIIFITNRKGKSMPRIKGHFVSKWSEGTVKTNCELDPETGELFPETVDTKDLGSLEKEYFETPDGDEIPVCSTCHEFILKTAMFPAVGKSLIEGSECSNLDCDSRE